MLRGCEKRRMQVRMFLTDYGSAHGTAPVLYLEDRPGVIAPPHPTNGQWRYFATVKVGDPILALEAEGLKAALEAGRHHIGEQLPF
jgi:hypothetical protein